MRHYTIKRYYTPQGTFGDLSKEDGSKLCHTVERPHASFSSDHPCIPEGTYIAERYQSPNPNHGLVWLLKEVPDRTFIEFHIANWPSELLGCIAPGLRWGCDSGTLQWGVLESGDAYRAFMADNEAEETIQLTFINGSP
jgi:hypothetical protein